MHFCDEFRHKLLNPKPADALLNSISKVRIKLNTMPFTIENPVLPTGSISGSVQYFELANGIFPIPPVITNPNPLSIQTDQNWQVQFNFNASGVFFLFFGAAVRWRCDILMEQYGPGENPASLPSIILPGVNALSNNFTGTINIPANTVPDGVYKMVARLSMLPLASNRVLAAGFEELNLVQFYTG
jgi:hypothetical protein